MCRASMFLAQPVPRVSDAWRVCPCLLLLAEIVQTPIQLIIAVQKLVPHGKTGLYQRGGGGVAVCCSIFRIGVCTISANNSSAYIVIYTGPCPHTCPQLDCDRGGCLGGNVDGLRGIAARWVRNYNIPWVVPRFHRYTGRGFEAHGSCF